MKDYCIKFKISTEFDENHYAPDEEVFTAKSLKDAVAQLNFLFRNVLNDHRKSLDIISIKQI